MGDTGWARIHQGHGLDLDMLRADLIREHGDALPGQELRIRELHFGYAPRVMWCGQYGTPCELQGEWHGHWYEVQPSSDSAVTVAEWQQVPQETAVNA
ncbi:MULTISPECIES: hypothetical protein [Mycolicibacter]|uniref:DUF551 domain-containing protein n=2 Tax=Mycolicibacter TaxID=1073531 RepID=A0ABU5XL53_9MYCO|nr:MULTISPECIES: hypothetical protein [unclassified Mycolicibacter]MEB3023015.1 hypothetical protein [Mycolicibacter sp. MYC098]MEB3033525.1 hypothetical protein [Mycolicibacter sp. MYC340]